MDFDSIKDCGIYHYWEGFHVFFGGTNITLDELIEFSSNHISVLKQTHETKMIESTANMEQLEADAQWAAAKSPLPIIKTADCLPVMVADPLSRTSLCIHAGWRGVKAEIVPLTIQERYFKSPERLKIWIGPHIRQESFEVDRDVADSILENFSRDDQIIYKKGEKYHIDLSELVVRQLLPLGVMRSQIDISEVSTVQDSEFYSHRNKEKGRNFSFCIPS